VITIEDYAQQASASRMLHASITSSEMFCDFKGALRAGPRNCVAIQRLVMGYHYFVPLGPCCAAQLL